MRTFLRQQDLANDLTFSIFVPFINAAIQTGNLPRGKLLSELQLFFIFYDDDSFRVFLISFRQIKRWNVVRM